MLRTAFLMTGDREQAMDLTQDTFALAYRKWPHVSGNGAPGSVEPAARHLPPLQVTVKVFDAVRKLAPPATWIRWLPVVASPGIVTRLRAKEPARFVRTVAS